ncbi:MAG: hypothetical protein H0S82_09300, partial [Anaerolineaceae bacterium]|nr:hypothetical protein [Anaerolineaceae bacterium]
ALSELVEMIPLSLRLADTDRIGYYMIGWDAVTVWEVPGYSQAQVLLPNHEAIREILLQAIDDIMQPGPLTSLVQTLEAQLTEQYEKTLHPSPTPTPTITPTPSNATVTPEGYP